MAGTSPAMTEMANDAIKTLCTREQHLPLIAIEVSEE
jgi:hypothetical protein